MVSLGATVVIVGAGLGGISCATALRRGGWQGRIALVGREPHHPYERPPLSKTVLIGATSPDALALADADALAGLDIDFLQREVTAIDRPAGAVVLADGARIQYDHLVLAIGSVARRLPVGFPGADAPGVHTIRTIEDALAVAEHLGTATDVVVIGGGFIGVEAAAAFASVGRGVSLLSAAPSLWARVAPAQLGDWLARFLRGLGVVVHTSTTAASIQTDDTGRVRGVTDTRGGSHPAQLVVVGIGAEPETGLARRAGLEVGSAIVVDEALRTEDPAISAVGDCAVQRRADGSLHRHESVQAAQDQGAHVAKRLLGQAEDGYDEVPWFYSDVGPARLQMAGRVHLATDLVLRGEPDDDDFSLFGYDGDRLVGLVTVNRPRDYLAGRAFLRSGRPLPRRVAADPAVDLRALSRAR